MKRLFYLLVFIMITIAFSSCSTSDSLEEIIIEEQLNELEVKDEKETTPTNESTQPARDPIPSKSPF
ncbi:MAG: hypothetical protein WBA74_11635 [Cyclobacteriaceae bacterium]